MKKDSEHHFRRFVRCRDAGDEAGKHAAWEELVIREVPRVQAFVRTWRGGGKLDHHEQEDAVSLAFERVWVQLVDSFRGEHVGEFVNAMRRCADFACLDVIEEAVKRSQRERHDDADAEGRSATQRALEAEQLRGSDHDRAVDERVRELYALIPRLRDEERLVVEHYRAGVPVEETCEVLGVSRDTLYQRRRRAFDALANLWSDDA